MKDIHLKDALINSLVKHKKTIISNIVNSF